MRIVRSAFVIGALLGLASAGRSDDLFTMSPSLETRWASPENPLGEKGKAAQKNAGRKGAPSIPLKAGQQYTLAQVSGASGTVRRIWVTLSDTTPRMLRGLRLDFYWDGARTPAVSAPFGDFFGIGLGRIAKFESALFSTGEGRSYVSMAPMPFRKSMKLVVTNESGVDLRSLYYDVNYTIGDKHGPDMLYFHTHFRRDNRTTLQRDYEILPKVEGTGRYLGVNIGVIANQKLYAKSWWGEGEVKMYMDGDTELPTISGTGTEDYIGTGWGQGQFANLFSGCTIADQASMRYCFYRYHIPDPVYFHKDLRVTIQQIGYQGPADMGPIHKAGTKLYTAGPGLVEKSPFADGLFERQDDWSSCVYFYLNQPENNLPKLMPVEQRTEGL